MKKEDIIDIVKVSTPGREGYYRITLKREIARRLNIRPGDLLVFFESDGNSVRVKVLRLQSQKGEE